jgi:hypothetical protein
MNEIRARVVLCAFVGMLMLGMLQLPAVSATPEALYCKQASWAETMVSTRAAYLEWKSDAGAKADIVQSPWHATPPLHAPAFAKELFPERGVALDAKGPAGEAIWTKHEEYRDGQVHNLPGRDHGATYLYRTLTVSEAATVRAFFGSDDGLA